MTTHLSCKESILSSAGRCLFEIPCVQIRVQLPRSSLASRCDTFGQAESFHRPVLNCFSLIAAAISWLALSPATGQGADTEFKSLLASDTLDGWLYDQGISTSCITLYHLQGNGLCKRYDGIISESWNSKSCLLDLCGVPMKAHLYLLLSNFL